MNKRLHTVTEIVLEAVLELWYIPSEKSQDVAM